MTKYLWLFLLIIVLPSIPLAAGAEEPDWSIYAQLLQRHSSPGVYNNIQLSQIDYFRLSQDPLWPGLVQQLAAFDPGRLATREEKLAFYINAYNILAVKVVLDHWPVESIKDAGSLFSSVWKRPAGKIGGKVVTLDEVEHDILRPLGEARIHFAIVCASVSCPDLRPQPYTAQQLDAQLHEQTQSFLDNPGKGLRVENHEIRVSKIFRWFEEDFEPSGGVSHFIRQYRPDLSPNMSMVMDIPYDWDLNGIRDVRE